MIAKQLAVKCGGKHEHGHLLSGRAGPAAKYTENMCRAIVMGILEQKAMDNNGMAQVTSIHGVKRMEGSKE